MANTDRPIMPAGTRKTLSAARFFPPSSRTTEAGAVSMSTSSPKRVKQLACDSKTWYHTIVDFQRSKGRTDH